MKKVKKFAVGGASGMPKSIGEYVKTLIPETPPPILGGPSAGGGGGAFGGLETVNQGSGQIGQSLRGIQQNLGAPGIDRGPQIPGNYIFKKGGKVSSASKRADGIATKGKTKGRMI